GGSLTRLQRSGNPGSHRLASALTNNHEVCMTAGFSAVRCSAVALACLDGQAAANAAEAVALEMPRTRQQLGDTLAQRWNGAGTAGEEHRIHSVMLHAGIGQQLVDTAGNAREQRRDGVLEGAAGQFHLQARLDALEVDGIAVRLGQLDLALDRKSTRLNSSHV